MRFGVHYLSDMKHSVILISGILVLVSSILEIVIVYRTLVEV